ncbi:MAG TPA: bifunctional riboflavin kinase/FAD synthetase [Thiothrix sp.]|nr:bifunctional riboflavin kinase/FAD synthetase [Thiothrix sp.]
MKLIRRIQGLHTEPAHEKSIEGRVATIGNFDGVHQGHQRIIQQLKALATQHQLITTLISFEPLPNEFFAQRHQRLSPTRIYPLRDKVRMLASLAIDEFVCLPFNASLAEQEPEYFIQQLLIKQLGISYLVVGDDFRFGKNRRGDFALLKTLGAQHGMQVVDTQTIMLDDERVSSSRIRQQLAVGNLSEVKHLLAHDYCLSGRVRHGDKRGRTIGFPTLNIALPEHIAVAKGVYAVRIQGLTDHVLTGVANIGVRPTVAGKEMRLEVHVFDYAADAYGKQVMIELVEFLRKETKFDSFDALKAQIVVDANRAKQCFGD